MAEGQESEEITAGQKFYDNIWLLMALGIVLPTLVFTVWGLYEVFTLPYLPIAK
jgi:hypothetical protein